MQQLLTFFRKRTVAEWATILFVSVCLFLASWYVAHGSIFFPADNSRDFLLMDEIVQKKVVLLGPRASGLPGLFHGPLWLYLNMPAYLLGGGSPVAVGWGWVGMVVVCLISSFWIAKQLVGKNAALIFVSMLAGMLIPWTYQLLNPFGALALMPVVVYGIVQYLQTSKPKFFLLTLLALGACVQFQMAVGVPLSMIGILWLLWGVWGNKQWKHLLLLPVMALPLSTFALFDLRHDFAQTKAVLAYIQEGSAGPSVPLITRLGQRLDLVSDGGFNVFTGGWMTKFNFLVGYLLVLHFVGQFFKISKKQAQVLWVALSLYLGFYAISVIFNGELLIHYWWPLVPLVYLMVATLLAHSPRWLLILFLSAILGSSLYQGVQFVQKSDKAIGLIEDDWKFQTNMAEKIFSGDEQELGYFIFTPDIYAYESKALMNFYAQKHPEKSVARYQKRRVTYLIIAPDPSFRPDILGSEWKKSKVRINRAPDEVFQFPDNYRVEKYILSDEELQVAPEPNIDDWIHFR